MVSIHDTNAYKNSLYNTSFPITFDTNPTPNSLYEYLTTTYPTMNISRIKTKLNSPLHYEIFIPSTLQSDYNILDYTFEGHLDNTFDYMILSMSNNLIKKVDNTVQINNITYDIDLIGISKNNGNIYII